MSPDSKVFIAAVILFVAAIWGRAIYAFCSSEPLDTSSRDISLELEQLRAALITPAKESLSCNLS